MWLQIILGLVGLASAILTRLRETNQLSQAEALIVAKQLQKALDNVQKANAAHAAVRDIPDERLRDPDPNSRD